MEDDLCRLVSSEDDPDGERLKVYWGTELDQPVRLGNTPVVSRS
jgi:hypothetical protein